jgi:chromosome segregation ATPase
MDITKAFTKLLDSPEKFMKEVKAEVSKLEGLIEKNDAQLKRIGKETGRLHDLKKEVERKKDAADASVAKASREKKEYGSLLDKADKRVHAMEAQMKRERDEIAKRENELDEKFLEMKKYEARIKRMEKEAVSRESALAASEQAHQSRVSNLRRAVTSAVQ